MPFNGFISYSHAADGRLAPAVQRGLHRLAKPWHRRRALWIFRDQTGLAVTPGLWSTIQEALDDSEWFVLLASPEAAASEWVNREIEHWVSTKPAGRILPVITDGEWAWDAAAADFTLDSTAVPPALRGAFTEEPLYLDLRWARDETHLDLRHSRFRDSIAQLAAPMHHVSKDELEGEDVRQHRLMLRLRTAAVTSLVALALVASMAGMFAVRNGNKAQAAAAETLRQQHVATEQKNNADRYAEQARAQEANARTQEKRAQDAAAEARRQEDNARRQAENARQQEALADQASTRAAEQERIARRQRVAADRATTDATQQKQLAERQEELALQAAEEALHQRRLAIEQQRLAAEATAEADKQRKYAAEQQRAAEHASAEAQKQQVRAEQQQRIAIGRRLINEAKAIKNHDTRTALMLGLAAKTIQPDTESRAELAGLVSSTRYTGDLPLRIAEGLAYGPDGLLAIAHTEDTLPHGEDVGMGVMSLWDMTNSARPVQTATMTGTDFTDVNSISFSPDGRTLAVASAEMNEAVLWNISDRRNPTRIGRLPGLTGVWRAAFSPYDQTLVTSRSDPEDEHDIFNLWDVTEPAQPIRLAEFNGEGNYRCAFSSDGRTIVTFGANQPAIIWDILDRKNPLKRAVLDGGKFGSKGAFSPTRSFLATHQGGVITIWDLTDPAQPKKGIVLRGLSGELRSLQFSSDGTVMAADDAHGNMRVWKLFSPFQADTIAETPGSGSPLPAMALSPDGSTLATAGRDSVSFSRLSNHGTPALSRELVDQPDIKTMAYDARSMTLATGSRGGTASFWDLSDKNEPVLRASITPAERSYVSFSSDARIMATMAGWSGRRRVELADVSDPTRPRPLGTLKETKTLWWSSDVVFSPDNRAALIDNELWDLDDIRNPRLFTTLAGDVIYAAAFSPDSKRMAVSIDGSVKIFDVTDRGHLREAASLGNSVAVTSLAYSPDGHILATANFDRTISLWDLANPLQPHHIAALAGYSGDIVGMAFDDAGATLATITDDGIGALWDTARPSRPVRLSTIKLTSSNARSALFIHSSQSFLTAGTAVNLWNYEELHRLREDPTQHVCAITGRGLTPNEWMRFIPELPYRNIC